MKEFKDMTINEKRNEVDSEYNKLILLLNETKKSFSIPGEINFKNYDQIKDANMSEDDYLKLIYDQVKDIRETILLLVYYLGNNVNVDDLKKKLEEKEN